MENRIVLEIFSLVMKKWVFLDFLFLHPMFPKAQLPPSFFKCPIKYQEFGIHQPKSEEDNEK